MSECSPVGTKEGRMEGSGGNECTKIDETRGTVCACLCVCARACAS